MALSLIDVVPIDYEREERRQLMTEMVRHKVVTTKLPAWWKSYVLSTCFGSSLTFLTILVAAGARLSGVLVGGATLLITELFRRMERSERESNRFMSGAHALSWECHLENERVLRWHIRDFNRAVRALERLPNIPTELREQAEQRLTKQREALLKRHERHGEIFETTFGPCIADLEKRGLHSRAASLETENRRCLIALADAVDHTGLKNKLLDLEPTTAALPELHDPLTTTEDIFDELERLHGHEIPRT